MRAVVQRVNRASVNIDGETVANIAKGFMVLICAVNGDLETDANYIAEKLAHLRIFSDEAGKMNLSITDVGGEILLVSQFTLIGDARKGNRPGFASAARPEFAVPLLNTVKSKLEAFFIPIKTGVFGADMEVELVNEGPVTILLDSRKTF
ncbi:MAG: D-aminoacyl-tRNA deacylase [Clostridia bacterium]